MAKGRSSGGGWSKTRLITIAAGAVGGAAVMVQLFKAAKEGKADKAKQTGAAYWVADKLGFTDIV